MIRGKHHKGQLTVFEILLVSNVLIARQEQVESTRFGGLKQLAILHGLPSKKRESGAGVLASNRIFTLPLPEVRENP